MSFFYLVGLLGYLAVFGFVAYGLNENYQRGKGAWVYGLILICFAALLLLFGAFIWVVKNSYSLNRDVENLIASVQSLDIIQSLESFFTFAIISIVFAFATTFAVKMIKENIDAFEKGSEARKAIFIAILIGCLLIGALFFCRVYINNALEELSKFPFGSLIYSVLGVLFGVLLPYNAAHNKRRRYYETFLLTFIPGFCWFSRLVGNPKTIWMAFCVLAGALVVFGQLYSSMFPELTDDFKSTNSKNQQ